MKTLLATILGAFALIAACSNTTASAQDSRSLYRAADQYRDAVIHFEDEARRVPQLDRFTLRMIDRLEDQSQDLRSASRRVSDLSRVLYEFNEIQSLHPRVGEAIFGSGCPIIQAALGPCWNELSIAYQVLGLEIQRLQSPGYRSGFRGNSCVAPSISPQLNIPFGGPLGNVPGVAPVPQLPPQGSFRVPTRGPQGFGPQGFGPQGFGQAGFGQAGFGPQGFGPVAGPSRPSDLASDRFRSSRPDLGNLIMGSLLSRFGRGL